MVDEKKKIYMGFLSDEGAVHLVAQDLSIEFCDGKVEETLPLEKLVPGLNDVTVVGRIITIWPLKSFNRPGGGNGTLLRLLIVDNTGKTMCAFWNPASEVLNLNSRGELFDRIVKIAHGYTRKGLTGDVELHIGERGEINLISNAEDHIIPSLDSFISRIADVKSEERRVNLRCHIEETPQIIVFNRSNGEEGRVARIMVSDHSTTSTSILVAWDDKVEELSSIRVGDSLMILNAKINILNDMVEIHADRGTVLNKI